MFSMLWQIKVPQHPCPNWILLPKVGYNRILWGRINLVSFLSSHGQWSWFFPTGMKLLTGRWRFLLCIPIMERQTPPRGDLDNPFLSQEFSFSIESRWGGMRYSLVINEWLLFFPIASVVHTVTKLLRLERSSWDHVIQPPAKAGSDRAGCSGLCLVRFWISPQMDAPQPLWATCSVFDHPHR